MYNATSTESSPGSDEIETYKSWLERQLISRIDELKKLNKTNNCYPCPNCQGGGCPVCCGSGTIPE